jgi:hypothetical protein
VLLSGTKIPGRRQMADTSAPEHHAKISIQSLSEPVARSRPRVGGPGRRHGVELNLGGAGHRTRKDIPGPVPIHHKLENAMPVRRLKLHAVRRFLSTLHRWYLCQSGPDVRVEHDEIELERPGRVRGSVEVERLPVGGGGVVFGDGERVGLWGGSVQITVKLQCVERGCLMQGTGVYNLVGLSLDTSGNGERRERGEVWRADERVPAGGHVGEGETGIRVM